jgi:hypothetical protein
MSTFITVIGTLGAVALLYGYAMVSAGKMSGDGLPYQALNFGGAATLMINSGFHSAWPSAILNMVWSGIGVVTLGRLIASRSRKKTDTAGAATSGASTPGTATPGACACGACACGAGTPGVGTPGPGAAQAGITEPELQPAP